MMRKLILVVFAATAFGLVSTTSRAQSYPEKPVTLVIPYSAGGPTDVFGRALADKLSQVLGVGVVIDNRPGASTMLGANHVAAAAKDGHTALIVTTTTLSLNPTLYKKTISYKVSDFAPVALVGKVPIGLAVRADLPVSTIKEFQDYVKRSPKRMKYGSAGTGANSQMVNALANQTLGIEMTEVPYKGTAPALTDMVAGHVDALVDAVATLAPLHRAGKIKILGNFDSERSVVAPDVPTFAESGFPTLVAFTWNAVVVPAGTPNNVVAKLNAALVETLNDPETRKKIESIGFIPLTSTPEELHAYIGKESERWAKLIEQMGISLD
jgi:tripartite-type tricarboxylate transporter receptor subunit TctC